MTDRYQEIRDALADLDAAAEAHHELAWRDAHARFVVHANPKTIRALLAERDALEAENERLHEQLRLATVDQAIAEAEASDAHAENKRLQESLAALEQEAGRG